MGRLWAAPPPSGRVLDFHSLTNASQHKWRSTYAIDRALQPHRHLHPALVVHHLHPKLDERHNLGGKTLHTVQGLLHGDTGAANNHREHHVADAHLRVAFDVLGDLRGRTREWAARAIGEPLGFVLVVPACAIGEIYAGGIAPRFQRMLLELDQHTQRTALGSRGGHARLA